MLDRYHSLTVVLDRGIGDDDAKSLLSAIRMLRGVMSVTGVVSDVNSHMAEERAKSELGQKLLAIVYPKLSPPITNEGQS